VAAVLDLSELFDASYGRLVAQLYALCGDLTTAEDAVQGAFVPAIRKSRELARVRSPEAWMRAVAVRWPGARASMGWYGENLRRAEATAKAARLQVCATDAAGNEPCAPVAGP
jgi:predicted RNA polymerase sigma factor